MEKQIPILFEKEADCCSCSACYSICPVKAISMIRNRKGFEYPHIDSKLCIGCFQCIRVCPLKTRENQA